MTEQIHDYTFTAPKGGWPVFTKVACCIPARGGSKGIPGKNLVDLNGKPLLYYTIEQAQGANLIDIIMVSSDDERILGAAEGMGAKVVERPAQLSGDFAPSEWALVHALKTAVKNWNKLDAVVMLQCTSPVRSSQQIDAAIRLVLEGGFDSVLSVVERHQFVWQVGNSGVAQSMSYNPIAQRPRRQDCTQYVENGSIYVTKPHILAQGTRLGGKIGLFKMPPESGYEIDSPSDLKLVEWIMGEVPD